MTAKNAMVIAPFTLEVDSDTETLNSGRRELLERIILLLESEGHDVSSAQKREAWGKEIMPPETCTPLDYVGIRNADVVVAIPGDPASGGTHIELGWATAHGKQLVVLLEQDRYYSPLVYGLGSAFDNVQYVSYGTPNDCLEGLENALSNINEHARNPVRKFAKPVALAASILFAAFMGYAAPKSEAEPTLLESRALVFADFARGLELSENRMGGNYTYEGVHGSVISSGDSVLLNAGYDLTSPNSPRFYGIPREVAKVYVARELAKVQSQLKE